MTFLNPLLTVDAYDADDSSDAPRTSNAYFSWKDFRVIGAVLLVVGGLLYPIYQAQVRKSLEYKSKNNMIAIYKAIQQYMGENDDRYPPAYATAEGSTAPYLENGKPYVWANLPSIDGGINTRVSFRCPAADPKEVTKTLGSRSAELTYGLYAPLSGIAAGDVDSLSGTILLGETSTGGALDSYNPSPMLDENGQPFGNDGFLIGFNDSNDRNSGEATAVTRLAYRGVKDGKFDASKAGRHDGGNHFIFADGHLEKYDSKISLIRKIKRGDREEYDNPWPVPSRSWMNQEE